MVKIFPNIEELNNFAAEKFVEIANHSIEKRGQFTVALAGGSTPKLLYRSLASDEFKAKIDWTRVFFFFGDERNVLPDDAESNFRMANENLLQPLQIPDKNILRWQTELKNAETIAENYEQTIKNYFTFLPDDFPKFDLILLGMGADGHTASLFPMTEALHETEKIVVANAVKKLNATRLTFTFSTINNAANVMFLVAGTEKAETLREVLEGEFQSDKFPSQNVKPKNGELFWLIDTNVAKLLSNNGN
ncbi:MAG: 6-phosphogluconolactonase [Actinomycetota bacterium]